MLIVNYVKIYSKLYLYVDNCIIELLNRLMPPSAHL